MGASPQFPNEEASLSNGLNRRCLMGYVHTYMQAERQTDRQADRDRDRDRQRQRQTQTDRDRQRQGQRLRHRHIHRCRHICIHAPCMFTDVASGILTFSHHYVKYGDDYEDDCYCSVDIYV